MSPLKLPSVTILLFILFPFLGVGQTSQSSLLEVKGVFAIELGNFGQTSQLDLQETSYPVDTVELRRCGSHNIESMVSTGYSYTFGQMSTTGRGIQTRKYDEIGRLISIYDDNSKNTFLYDKKGNITESLEYPLGSGTGSKIRMSYDSLGRMTEKANYDWNEKLNSRIVYSYDNNGNLTESRSYNADNSYYFHKYEYNGTCLSKETYGSVNGVASTVFSAKTFTFNSRGKVQSIVDGEMTYSFTYDSLGNLLSESVKGSEGIIHKKYEYDSRNNLIFKSEESEIGKPAIETHYKYDLSNRMIEQASSKSGKGIFQYDSKGLVESLTWYDAADNPTYTIKYTYTYY